MLQEETGSVYLKWRELVDEIRGMAALIKTMVYRDNDLTFSDVRIAVPDRAWAVRMGDALLRAPLPPGAKRTAVPDNCSSVSMGSVASLAALEPLPALVVVLGAVEGLLDACGEDRAKAAPRSAEVCGALARAGAEKGSRLLISGFQRVEVEAARAMGVVVRRPRREDGRDVAFARRSPWVDEAAGDDLRVVSGEQFFAAWVAGRAF